MTHRWLKAVLLIAALIALIPACIPRARAQSPSGTWEQPALLGIRYTQAGRYFLTEVPRHDGRLIIVEHLSGCQSLGVVFIPGPNLNVHTPARDRNVPGVSDTP